LKKIKKLKELMPLIRQLRAEGRRIVFTNGCFDLIHTGHVRLLKFAKSKGDCLILGLNTDDSISRLKGDNRPLLDEDTRGRVLESFEDVDYLIFFSEDTPENLIREIAPDVLVKGGDYQIEEVVGRESVWESGGDVILCPPLEGKSTTGIIDDIKVRFS
jgi:rfaE bifunctional protein nucleotidyltransferase chain/domain